MVDRRVGRALDGPPPRGRWRSGPRPRRRRRSPSPPPSTVRRVRISGQAKACTSGFAAQGPRFRRRLPRRLGAVDEAAQGRQEIVGDGAAQAAIRQLDDVAVAACRVAAASSNSPVDAELAELVDDDRQPVPAALASRWRTRLVLPAPRKPVTIVAGMRRIAQPPSAPAAPRGNKDDAVGERGDFLVEPASGVAELAAERVSGTRPSPTSLATSTIGPSASCSATRSSANSSSIGSPGQHQVGQPQRQAVDQQRRSGSALARSCRPARAASRRCARTGPRPPLSLLARCAAIRAAISASPASAVAQ